MIRDYVRRFLIFAIILLSLYNCSSEPCEDLRSKAESCYDEEVRALLMRVSKNGDKQECKDYLDSYYYTFESRCNSYGVDSSSIDAIDDTAVIEDSDISL